MKQQISAKAFLGVILIVLALVGFVGWRSQTGVSASSAASSGKPPPPPSPGPTPEQLREMRQFNATHATTGGTR